MVKSALVRWIRGFVVTLGKYLWHLWARKQSYRTHRITPGFVESWLVETNVICAGRLTDRRLFQDMVSLSPLSRSGVFWVTRPFPMATFFGNIAAKSGYHRGILLWAKYFTLNAHCEMIFVEIFWVNLIHTLKKGIYLWYLSSGQLHFRFWPGPAQKPELKIGVIGKSFMATWVLRNLEKAAGLTWNRVRGWGQNELSTRCCTEIDFTSKK